MKQPFYIGEEVVCVDSVAIGPFQGKYLPENVLKKGERYIILGIRKGSCKCASIVVDVGIDSNSSGVTKCSRCGTNHISDTNNWWFNANRFASLPKKKIEYRIREVEVPSTLMAQANKNIVEAETLS